MSYSQPTRHHLTTPYHNPNLNQRTSAPQRTAPTHPHHNHNRNQNNNPHQRNPTHHPAEPRTPSPLVLLSHCTTSPPLTDDQLLALSDEVGSLRELVVLALGAASGDVGCEERLVGALGERGARGVVEFFAVEWEVE